MHQYFLCILLGLSILLTSCGTKTAEKAEAAPEIETTVVERSDPSGDKYFANLSANTSPAETLKYLMDSDFFFDNGVNIGNTLTQVQRPGGIGVFRPYQYDETLYLTSREFNNTPYKISSYIFYSDYVVIENEYGKGQRNDGVQIEMYGLVMDAEDDESVDVETWEKYHALHDKTVSSLLNLYKQEARIREQNDFYTIFELREEGFIAISKTAGPTLAYFTDPKMIEVYRGFFAG